MARGYNRLFVKKRKHRRTGSSTWGRAWEAMFFAGLCAAGLLGLIVFVLGRVVPEWKVRNDFEKNTCLVLDKRVGESEEDNTLVYRPEIRIAYEVDGAEYEIWTYDIWTLDTHGGYTADEQRVRQIVGHFQVGRRYMCWYNPKAPGEAILAKRGPWWDWLAFFVPASLVILGSVGLAYRLVMWNTSVERRAALAKRRDQIEVFARKAGEGPEFPHIPDSRTTNDSPGTHLAYRLPTSTSSGILTALVVGVAALWNFASITLLISYVQGLLNGTTHWANILILLPLAAFGVWPVMLASRRLVVLLGIGPTLIEMSGHPLKPGNSYRIFIGQSGKLQMLRLRAVLVCDEEATYRQGTNTRKETRRVYEDLLLDREDFEIQRQRPFETECVFTLPEGLMHSFESPRNRVAWKILVMGEAEGWPPFERVFRIVVHPNLSNESDQPS